MMTIHRKDDVFSRLESNCRPLTDDELVHVSGGAQHYSPPVTTILVLGDTGVQVPWYAAGGGSYYADLANFHTATAIAQAGLIGPFLKELGKTVFGEAVEELIDRFLDGDLFGDDDPDHNAEAEEALRDEFNPGEVVNTKTGPWGDTLWEMEDGSYFHDADADGKPDSRYFDGGNGLMYRWDGSTVTVAPRVN